MKKFSYRFRSIMVNNVEKVIPGTVFTRLVIEMDENSVEQHMLELSLSDILKDRTWILYLFLSFMSVWGIAAIIFGLLYIGPGRGMDAAAWSALKLIFLVIAMLLFISLWVFLSVRGSIGHHKREYVEKERGKGNWRIVDEKKWDEFYRLLQISKKKREDDLQKFLNS